MLESGSVKKPAYYTQGPGSTPKAWGAGEKSSLEYRGRLGYCTLRRHIPITSAKAEDQRWRQEHEKLRVNLELRYKSNVMLRVEFSSEDCPAWATLWPS